MERVSRYEGKVMPPPYVKTSKEEIFCEYAKLVGGWGSYPQGY
jgi:hypothetical protein